MSVPPGRSKSSPKLNPFASFGVLDWGYTEEAESQSFTHYQSWLAQGKEAPLTYLSGEKAQKRQNLKHYYPEFQSALVFLFSYEEARAYLRQKNSAHKVASYVFGFEGRDYHFVLKEKLNEIAQYLQLSQYKVCIDTAPVLERDLAYRAGLGWFGKNSMLINRRHGSFFLLASLLVPQKLPQFSAPLILETDHCGQCRRCIEACPTQAIDPHSRTLNASACISTFTIELFRPAPAPVGYEKSQGEIFGCDICQEVCPWNEQDLLNAVAPQSESFQLLEKFLLDQPVDKIKEEMTGMSERSFRKKFQATSLHRGGKSGLLKNILAFQKFFQKGS